MNQPGIRDSGVPQIQPSELYLIRKMNQTRIRDFCSRQPQALEFQFLEGNQARAARWLGVSRITMREKLHHFGLHPAQKSDEAE